jgi:hypothetical protein
MITRLQILQEVKDNHENLSNLCYGITETAILTAISVVNYYGGVTKGFSIIANALIPKFTFENAEKFGAKDKAFWWKPFEWNTGRMNFLNWLINEYNDDTEDITPIIKSFIK